MPDVRRILPVLRDQAADDAQSYVGDSHVVSNHNRWSRLVFDLRDVPSEAWGELCFHMAWHQDEEARTVQDFASIGIDFLTEDGSSIDFAYVPGLSRAQLDPQCCYIPGTAYHDRNGDHANSSRLRYAFFIPVPAKHLILTIRSWRNTHPFTISHLQLRQTVQVQNGDGRHHRQQITPASRRTWQDLSTTPHWQSYAVVRGHPLFVRGQLVNWGQGRDGALARVVFRDAQGEPIAPPYDGIPVSSEVGAHIDLPVHRQTRRFTLELVPPPAAAKVDLGFQAWRSDSLISLASSLEVSPSEDLLLENILDDENPDALSFLEKACIRLGHRPVADTERVTASPADQFIDRESLRSIFTFHDKLRVIQHGEATAIADGGLTLCGLEPWPLPEALAWTEDPYQSQAWRLEFQSLSWLLDLEKSPELGGTGRAVDLAVSWARSNPWGHPKDALSAYPLSMSMRAEVFLRLLASGIASKSGRDIKPQRKLLAEIIRYGFALSEIVSQGIFSLSVVQLRMACTLLAIARAIPRFPLSPYWASVAVAQLKDSFDQLIGEDGSSIEQSLHHRLEIISIGLLLVHEFEGFPEVEEIRGPIVSRLKNALKVIVGITDPAGMLPSIGDMPPGHHHASWLRRLISGYGRSLLSDPDLAEELSYPTGSRMFASDAGGVIALRQYDRKPYWSYLCTSYNEQRHENSHFDCSSFVYAARGTRWITDAGGANPHDSSPVRHYLTSSRAHNVAAPDGLEQTSGIGWIEARASVGGANIVRIGTNVYGPTYDHARIFIGLDNLDAVAVFDRFRCSEKPVMFEGLLHFDESAAVALAGSELAIGFRNKARLKIIPRPVTGVHGGMTIYNGRNDRPGSLQGLVSHPRGGLQPANVLSYRFSGAGDVCGGVILAATEQGLRQMTGLLASQEIQKFLS